MDENLNSILSLVWELLNCLSGGRGGTVFDINIGRARKSEVERKINNLQPQQYYEIFFFKGMLAGFE